MSLILSPGEGVSVIRSFTSDIFSRGGGVSRPAAHWSRGENGECEVAVQKKRQREREEYKRAVPPAERERGAMSCEEVRRAAKLGRRRRAGAALRGTIFAANC